MRLPTIIALYAFIVGVAQGVMLVFGLTIWDGGGAFLPTRTINEVGYVALWLTSAAFLPLSYFVFARRDWARRALLWSSAAMGVAICLTYWGIWWTHAVRLTIQMRSAGELLYTAAAPLFLAALLRHPLVISSFRSDSRDHGAPTI